MPDRPQAVALTVSARGLDLRLADGRRVIVPLGYYHSLVKATPRQRRNWELLGWGTGFEWPDLDLQHSVEGIIAGRREHVPAAGFRAWLTDRQKTLRM